MTLSPRDNPFDDGLKTPTKPHIPVSDKATPTSLVRNMFARNRSDSMTPTESASRGAPSTQSNMVVLPPTKKSLGVWSPSPEEDDQDFREGTPTPFESVKNGHRSGKYPKSEALDIKPKLEPISLKLAAVDDIALPAPHLNRTIDSSKSDGESSQDVGKRRGPSPTFRNNSSQSDGEQPSDPSSQRIVADSDRPTKRVRLASQNGHSQGSNPLGSQPISTNSVETLERSEPTDGSSSTLRRMFSPLAWQPRKTPPAARDVMATMDINGLPTVIYQDPYFSNPADVPSRAKMFAGRMFQLKGSSVSDLYDFDFTTPLSRSWLRSKRLDAGGRSRYGWEFATPPPSRQSVVKWCDEETEKILEICERNIDT